MYKLYVFHINSMFSIHVPIGGSLSYQYIFDYFCLIELMFLFEITRVFHSNITCLLICFTFYSLQMDFSSYIFFNP